MTDRNLITEAQGALKEILGAKNGQIQGLVQDISKYRSAITELTSINSSHIVSMPQSQIAGSTAPTELTPQTSFLRQANLLSQLSDFK